MSFEIGILSFRYHSVFCCNQSAFLTTRIYCFLGQSQTLLRSTNYHDAIQTSGRSGHPANGNSMASSRATLDTALYSNVRSRPSSMLFNDSGFVRFVIVSDFKFGAKAPSGT